MTDFNNVADLYAHMAKQIVGFRDGWIKAASDKVSGDVFMGYARLTFRPSISTTPPTEIADAVRRVMNFGEFRAEASIHLDPESERALEAAAKYAAQAVNGNPFENTRLRMRDPNYFGDLDIDLAEDK